MRHQIRGRKREGSRRRCCSRGLWSQFPLCPIIDGGMFHSRPRTKGPLPETLVKSIEGSSQTSCGPSVEQHFHMYLYPACLLTAHPLVGKRITVRFLAAVLSVFDFDYADELPSLSASAILRQSNHSATLSEILSMDDLRPRLENQ